MSWNIIPHIYRIIRPKNGAQNDMKLSGKHNTGNTRVMFDVVTITLLDSTLGNEIIAILLCYQLY